MTAALRRQVRVRFRFACAYCGVTEASVGAQLTIDHYQPRSAQGTDDLENLVYACPACNQFKGEV
nr:HNH endonuclease signature motif containing protein [Armatimonas sp.]